MITKNIKNDKLLNNNRSTVFFSDNKSDRKERLQHSCKQNKGQALVETALVLPIIIILLMGIVDFGMLFNNYIMVSTASREAARCAAVGGTDAEITAVINGLTATLVAADRTVTITPALSLRKNGVQTTITVNYNYHLITPIIGAMFSNGVAPLQSKTVMRVE